MLHAAPDIQFFVKFQVLRMSYNLFFAPTWDIRLDNHMTMIKATKETLYDKANLG